MLRLRLTLGLFSGLTSSASCFRPLAHHAHGSMVRRLCIGMSAPTVEEMQPGSPEMIARAASARERLEAQILTPLEAFTLVGDEVSLPSNAV